MKAWIAIVIAAPILLVMAVAGLILLSPAQVLARMPPWIPHPGGEPGFRELGGTVLVLQVDANAAHAAESSLPPAPDAIAASIPILRTRLEALGVRGGNVQRQGADRIVVEAPGAADSVQLRAVMTDAARLTFQLVDDSYAPGTPLPPDDELVADTSRPCQSSCVLAVNRRVWVAGDMIASAVQGFNPSLNAPVVEFRLTPAGAFRFGQVTHDNVGRRFAVIFDGRVVTAPNIEAPIVGGEGEISGNFTQETASDLALLLRSGELPAPLMIVEQHQVKPSA